MSGYFNHIKNRFGSCRHVANARDPHRNRDVKLYHIPGQFDVVGITDGVDFWVSTTNIDPFSAGIKRIFDDIRAGKQIQVSSLTRARTRVDAQMELPLQPKQRVRIETPAQPRSRNRV